MNQSKDYVDLGFWNATHLTKHLEHLVSENRKLMKSLRYRSLEEIDTIILVDVLKEAHSLVKS